MAITGALAKMLILAYETAEKAEQGGLYDAKKTFKALINPESYTTDLKLVTADTQGQGSSATQSKFGFIAPEEMSFEFLFDNTGIIDFTPKPQGLTDEINAFRDMLLGFQGDDHETFHLRLLWGSLIFTGRAVEVSINYKLFNADGQPIRAIAKVKFKHSVELKKQAAKEDRKSPDLTHRRIVKAGDTLPLMCYRIYGDPRYYLLVAKENGFNHFAALSPGTEVVFPPLKLTTDRG